REFFYRFSIHFFKRLCHNVDTREHLKGAIFYMQQKLKDALFQDAIVWVKEAGELIKRSFMQKLTVQYKTNFADLVTNVDKQVEKFFIEKINNKYKDHRILSEEGFG